MPIVTPFDPASVVEVPPPPIPPYDAEGYFNPDRDQFVTYKQACAIVKVVYHPQLHVAETLIMKPTGPFPPSERKGKDEHDYRCKWSNGFRQTLAAIGRQLDIEEKNTPGEGIKRTLRKIYAEMEAVGHHVDWWVKDRVK